jgi:hypothetical protein
VKLLTDWVPSLVLACFLVPGGHSAESEVRLPQCRPCSSSGQQCSATINNITMPKPKSNPQAALQAIEKVLGLMRSVQTLEGTDKDGAEHPLERAVENLNKVMTRCCSIS